jgi:hypothetical protein
MPSHERSGAGGGGLGVRVGLVTRVMAGQDEPMRVVQVHAAVEALLGEAVPKSSVNWCLSTSVGGDEAPFVRVARGRYAACGEKRAEVG